MDVVDSDDTAAAPTATTATTTRDPRAPEKENTIRRRLKGGPAAVARARGSGGGGGGVKTRKMAATAAKSGAPKSSAPAPAPAAPVPVPGPGPAPVVMDEPPAVAEGPRVSGAAGRLLAAVHGGGGIGPRRVPIDSTGTGLPTRRVS